MIRYVLAVALSVALLALAVPAIDHAATKNTERTLEANVASIDEAATSLAADEEVSPDGHPEPRRIVSVSLPEGSLTTAGVDHFEIVPHGNYSTARYVLEDGTTRQQILDERIVHEDPDANRTVELAGPAELRLVITLEADADGEPVVVAKRA